MSSLEPTILKTAKSSGLSKFNIAGFQFDLSSVEQKHRLTYSESLSMLSDAIKLPIVLIIDEVQHAITTEKGSNALFALKAARDELNSSSHYGFRLVATGSSRDKLAMLVNSKEHAFFGAPLVDMPHLDMNFVNWKLEDFGDIKPSNDIAEESFTLCGFRPEYFSKVVSVLSYQMDLTKENINERLMAETRKTLDSAKDSFLQQVSQLPAIESAILLIMAEDGIKFAPFHFETIERLKEKLFFESEKINGAFIQKSLDSLRDRGGFVWMSSRGVYSMEDSQCTEWLLEQELSKNEATQLPSLK